jgi:hypothetical protein
MIKAITGKANWYDAPVKSMEMINTELGSLANTVSTNEVDIESKMTSLTSLVNTNETDIESKVVALMNTVGFNKTDIEGKMFNLAGAGRTVETVKAINDDLQSHKQNKSNPHNVTATQIGITPIASSPSNLQGALEWFKQQMDNIVAGAVPEGSIGIEQLSFDPATQDELNTAISTLDAHVSDITCHVTKDGTLQENLNSQLINSIYIRSNNGALEWSNDNNNWIPTGNLEKTLLIDATSHILSGTKKADTSTWKGQCIYANISTSGSYILTQGTFNNLRYGYYSLITRLKSANNTLTTDSIRIDIQKNNNDTWNTIGTRTLKANMFINTTEYQNYYIPFDYKPTKATNNELRVVITLLQQTSAYEVALDSIEVLPNTIGIFAQ